MESKYNVPVEWKDFFDQHAEETKRVLDFVAAERKKHVVYPPEELVFKALEDMAPDEVKVVPLGQDPYHNGNATGRCFEVPPTANTNPSLRNIMFAVNFAHADMKTSMLDAWAAQGVLLLNTSLTVCRGKPGSHLHQWAPLMRKLLSYIEAKSQPLWLLWGRKAQLNCPSEVPDDRRFEAPHPSPLAGKGFLQTMKYDNHFTKVNTVLKRDINWST